MVLAAGGVWHTQRWNEQAKAKMKAALRGRDTLLS